MQNLEKILNEYKNSNLNADDVKNAVSEIFAKFENREGSELKEALKTKMGEIFALFRRENLLNANDLKNAMEGVNQAISAKKESELYAMICEQERLAKLIDKKRGEIKNALKISFEAAEETIKGEEFSGKDEILGLLNDAIMRETRMFEILRESALNAFLTTIEQGRDVGETAAQVAKQTTYVATIEGEFSKERILEIARKVVSAACEAATGIVMTSATTAVVRVSMRRLLKITYFHPEGGGHRSGACAYNETVCIVSALRERLSIRGRSTSTRGRWNRPKPTHIVKKQVWIRRRRLRLTMSLQVTLVVRLLTSPGRSGCKAMINLRTKRQTPGCSDRGKGDRNEHKPQISCREKLIS